MMKSYDCVKCGGHHPRPINRNCKQMQIEEPEQTMDTNVMILKELQTLSSRMTELESKVQSLDVMKLPSTSSTSRQPCNETETELVLPSLDRLRSFREIQDQVDARIKELQTSQDKGKLKSQRGGTETVFVKREVPWLQNYTLRGTSKSRVSYDSLSISQWVSGFAMIIKHEPDIDVKQDMLEHRSEIMEDSRDFGWGAAKGAHAVLLCKMEEGRINWAETNKIDRIRRAHAHKVQNPSSRTQNTKCTSAKDQPTPCKFFQKSGCSHKSDHETNGHMYLHVCSQCFVNGKKFPRALKDCRRNAKNDKPQ